jgi:hypothetical protein
MCRQRKNLKPTQDGSLILKLESALFQEDKPHVDHYQKMQMIFFVDSFKKHIILLQKKVFRY